MLTPTETLESVKSAGIKKATSNTSRLVVLGFLAGLFIAFAALASTIVSMNLLKNPETFGIGKLLQGLIFSGGLIFVVIGGAELFTGNSLMAIAFLDGKITSKELIRNWCIVYLSNFLGAFFLALCVYASGIYNYNNGLLGNSLISIAISKISLDFFPALILGILCNILVCLAVWMAFAAKTVQGKILAIIFPVTFFVVCGFEHSIANMFYIPAGFLVSDTFSLAELLNNLIPVTIGNIIGGGLFIACAYFYSINNVKINLCLENEKTQIKPSSIPQKKPQQSSARPQTTKRPSQKKSTKTPKKTK